MLNTVFTIGSLIVGTLAFGFGMILIGGFHGRSNDNRSKIYNLVAGSVCGICSILCTLNLLTTFWMPSTPAGFIATCVAVLAYLYGLYTGDSLTPRNTRYE